MIKPIALATVANRTQNLKTTAMKLPIIVKMDKRYFRNMALLYPVVLWLGGRKAYMAVTGGTDWISMNVWLLLTLILFVFFIRTVRKWLDPKPGLIIAKEGLTDNASIVKAGLLAWKDVKAARYTDYAGAKQLMIDITNPEAYTKHLKYLNGKVADQMITDEGTPIIINDKFIRYDCSELVTLINKYARG
jgi:hypothetical protein